MSQPLAVQLYTLRHLSRDVNDLVNVVADAGYDGVEASYSAELAAAGIKQTLDARGVKMASAHVSLADLETGLERVLEFFRTVGSDVVVLPWLDKSEYDASAQSWQTLGERLNAIAEQVKAADMTLLYHNHDFEFDRYEGKLALEHLLDSAPELGLELDFGWCYKGGVDPLPLLKKYAGNVLRVHVKDRAPEGENADQDGWADVGHGEMTWPPLLQAADAAGAQWYIVEHDLPANPKESIERSLKFLKQI